ncbi:restriction endonuclease subunit S [Bacillus toyonensis]|uniref:restriction endonuclease subunit S n=1 Tax=Bacillus toyonensis TaxID=155322 RepID=UPI000BEB54BE|nr:restriction endonuclease subunit S [Bacillus toyonensis]PED17656.1 restriction endonuclease [Bacillus toyonensis]PFY01674.1 restriction endonuclease [Bacillus toyonensis]
MSKKKKTNEDLLEGALLSEEELPYEVPENWVWTRLGSVFEQKKEQIQPTGKEKYIGLEHLNKGGGILEVGNTEGVKSKKVVFKTNDVLYGKLRPYLNKHAHVSFEGVASTDILVYRNKNITTNKLLNMYLNLPHVLQYTNENSNGINLPRVSPKSMDVLPFPLPPLNEQKRIAKKVERLLSKIEEAKQLVEEAKETFELRRLAILSKAFQGELTERWRTLHPNQTSVITLLDNIKDERNAILESNKNLRRPGKKITPIELEEMPFKIPNKWCWERLGNISTRVVDGTHHKPTYTNDGIPFISVKDIRNNQVDFRDTKFISETEHRELAKRCNPEKGDILITKSGSTIGRTAVVNTEQEFSLFVSVALVKLNGLTINSRYVELVLEFLINQAYGEKFIKGSAIKNLHLDQLINLPIPLPFLDEQDEIVGKINYLFEKEFINLKNVNELEERLEILKNSILLKAFRGELGTNDPTEESAIELLKEVLQEQVK